MLFRCSIGEKEVKMNVNVDFNDKAQCVTLTFKLNEFEKPRDYSIAIAILTTFCGDFNLDPDMEEADLEAIIERAKELTSDRFLFYINEDEVEAEIPDTPTS